MTKLKLSGKMKTIEIETELEGRIQDAWQAIGPDLSSAAADPGLRRWLETRRASIRQARRRVYNNGGLFDRARNVPSKED